MPSLISLAERGLLPDALIRLGIRQLLRKRLKEETASDTEKQNDRLQKLITVLRSSPIAVQTKKANEQHYEVPPEFFKLALGKHLKYSSCYFKTFKESLEEAEAEMLRLSVERAEIENGMRILELGCGWGSLTLWMALHFPNSQITAVSNSAPQRHYIEGQCRERNLTNVRIITEDMNVFEAEANSFDRVVSVEMFEHMRNYQKLMAKISQWLKPGGKLFVHIFTHKEFAYPFEEEGEDNWLGRYFFSGGIMPSDDLLLYFQDDLKIDKHWRVSGLHYGQTSELWLNNTDCYRNQIIDIFRKLYGQKEASLWLQRWRIFFMSCAELWNFRNGEEWIVSHYLFENRNN